MLLKNLHKILITLMILVQPMQAEDIYKVEVIVIKFTDVKTDEKFNNYLDFSPSSVKKLEENKIILLPEKFIENAQKSPDLLNFKINEADKDFYPFVDEEIKKVFKLYEYQELENLSFLIGRLRWRETIEILDSLSWYQPLTDKDEYTFHYDQKNDLSIYINIYQSRFLHINLKAFFGKLGFNDEEITQFINEDRRVKNSEISYFDHPSMGFVIKIDKT